jgi:hypothetical protein
MQAYRVPPRKTPDEIGDERSGDADLLPVFAIVWAGSVARVCIAISGHEDFGAEATAALLWPRRPSPRRSGWDRWTARRADE